MGNLLKIICLSILLSSCAFKTCDDLVSSFNGAKTNISSFNSSSKNQASNPIYLVNQKKSASAALPNLDYDQCVPFLELKNRGTDIYYVDTNISVAGDGSSWDKAFLTINNAITSLITKRTEYLNNGQAIPQAIIAIAGGNYSFSKEKVITNEIFSLYGYKEKLYESISFLGGFKSGDICKNVTKNANYDDNDPARKTVIDAEKQTKIISAIKAKNLVFSDFTFVNSTTKDIEHKRDGGAVSIKDSQMVTFNRITIANSYAHESAGAFFIQNSLNKIFLFDIFIANSHAKGNGGAIAILNSKVLINVINIQQSTSESSGGSIYSDNASELTLGYFVLSHNKAKNGAAIYNLGKLTINTHKDESAVTPIAQIFITNPYFDKANNIIYHINTITNNQALENGGAIYYAHNDELYLERIIIEHNEAKNGAGIYFANNAQIKLKNSRFLHNHALNKGGVFFFSNGINSLFIDDSAKSQAHNQYNIGIVKNNNIYNNFSYNKAKKGSVFAVENQVATKDDMRFRGGKYQYNEAQDAGVFYINSANVKKITINADFTNNKITNSDAAIFKSLHDLERLTIIGDFSNNTCTKDSIKHHCNGAAFNIDNVKNIKLGGSINEHTALNGGFLWIKEADDLVIAAANFKNSLITNNQAHNFGGVIYGDNVKKIVIEEQYKTPGGLSNLFLSIQQRLLRYKQADGTYLEPINLIFSYNKAATGGALYVKNSEQVAIKDTIFHGNIAHNGGAVYIKQTNDLQVKESFFSQNTASNHGGAIYVKKAVNALFNGQRDMHTRVNITVNRKEYMRDDFKSLSESNKNSHVNGLIPIENYLHDLSHFEHASYSSDKVYLPLAKNNIALAGAFVYFAKIHNLTLQQMSMVNNKNSAMLIENLSGNIDKDEKTIIYDDNRKIKNIEVFLDDIGYSSKYYIAPFPKGIIGASSYEYDGFSHKAQTGIKVLNPANKTIESD